MLRPNHFREIRKILILVMSCRPYRPIRRHNLPASQR
jgi:hypothetical protein